MAKKSRSDSPGKAEPYRVFLSHATVDKFVARCILEKVEAAGAKVFIDDRDIEGGSDIPDTIIQEIKASKEFILLLTPKSVGRQWVLVELGVALSEGIRIVPLLYQIESDQIPDVVKFRRGFNLNDFDAYLAELSTRLRR